MGYEINKLCFKRSEPAKLRSWGDFEQVMRSQSL